MPSMTPIAGFLETISSIDDPEKIRALYGDFVRKAFADERVLVIPNRAPADAGRVPQLSAGDDRSGRPARARLHDDLVIVSGPRGTLRQEHADWLGSLREATHQRLEALHTAIATDPLTGLGSERKFHEFLRQLSRKESWFGWLMDVTLRGSSEPGPQEVEEARQQVVDYLRDRHPAGAQLFRLDSGLFAGLIPSLSEHEAELFASLFREGLSELKISGGLRLHPVIATAPWPSQTGYPRAFWFRLKGGLEEQSRVKGLDGGSSS